MLNLTALTPITSIKMKKIDLPADDNAPVIVLVRPQLAENMGMVARAMMNCNLARLRLVRPRDDHLSKEAVSAASGAQKVLEEALVFDSVEEALADCHLVFATTARRRDMTKPVYAPQKAIDALYTAARAQQKTAVLFGAERTGLENGEVIAANGIIEIPLNPAHCSLNLSQAVLLIGYEWFQRAHFKENTHFETGGSALATKGETDAFLSHLEAELRLRGYFRFADKEERMRHNLRNIFTRLPLTHSEIKTLHGVVTDLIRIPDKKESE